MGFILFIIAILLSLVLFPVGMGYAMFRPKRGEYFYTVAYGIDQLGNVVCRDAFNKWLISDRGYKFGNPDETVSSVLGKNKLSGSLTRPGRFLERLLHLIDPGHSEKAIEENP